MNALHDAGPLCRCSLLILDGHFAPWLRLTRDGIVGTLRPKHEQGVTRHFRWLENGEQILRWLQHGQELQLVFRLATVPWPSDRVRRMLALAVADLGSRRERLDCEATHHVQRAKPEAVLVGWSLGCPCCVRQH